MRDVEFLFVQRFLFGHVFRSKEMTDLFLSLSVTLSLSFSLSFSFKSSTVIKTLLSLWSSLKILPLLNPSVVKSQIANVFFAKFKIPVVHNTVGLAQYLRLQLLCRAKNHPYVANLERSPHYVWLLRCRGAQKRILHVLCQNN